MYLRIVGNYNKINKETFNYKYIHSIYLSSELYGYVPTLSIPK